mmetsp:Transcript_81798/g.213408  ORF Transcript_81798/g.213408 Transcript_81798/m.213408 type:complete len:476 (-) Transcript_81798:283-1710(-)
MAAASGGSSEGAPGQLAPRSSCSRTARSPLRQHQWTFRWDHDLFQSKNPSRQSYRPVAAAGEAPRCCSPAGARSCPLSGHHGPTPWSRSQHHSAFRCDQELQRSLWSVQSKEPLDTTAACSSCDAQPCTWCLQHHSRRWGDQVPSHAGDQEQSKAPLLVDEALVVVVVTVGGQPTWCRMQHHSALTTGQLSSQVSKSLWQSKGSLAAGVPAFTEAEARAADAAPALVEGAADAGASARAAAGLSLACPRAVLFSVVADELPLGTGAFLVDELLDVFLVGERSVALFVVFAVPAFFAGDLLLASAGALLAAALGGLRPALPRELPRDLARLVFAPVAVAVVVKLGAVVVVVCTRGGLVVQSPVSTRGAVTCAGRARGCWQPSVWCRQHHAFFSEPQPACHDANPWKQSKACAIGSDVTFEAISVRSGVRAPLASPSSSGCLSASPSPSGHPPPPPCAQHQPCFPADQESKWPYSQS